jgi:protein-L-isoaspartate(D-aspartate) O-methyltransferase
MAHGQRPPEESGGVRRILAAFLVAATPLASADEDPYAGLRERMVSEQLMASPDGRMPIQDGRVLEAMRRVPRHVFVPPSLRSLAYTDQPLPIGEDQTISQPYIVALMTQLARIEPGEKALEISTGSGYQAAVLAELTPQVYTIEILEPLATRARQTLDELGLTAVRARVGDGYLGWPEEAPFDAIIVTAAAPRVPQPLVDQLAMNGRLVLPLGELFQELIVLTRTPAGVQEERVIPVRFVPMVGQVREPAHD